MQSNPQNFHIFYKKRKKMHIIRPLLVLNRLQILKICIFLRVPLYIDPTNQITTFRRNRLRHQICPLLKAFFNPKIDSALAKFILISDSENIYFNNHLKNIKKFIHIKNINVKKNRASKFKWISFLPNAMQRKFYQSLLLSYSRSLTFNEIEFLFRINLITFK